MNSEFGIKLFSRLLVTIVIINLCVISVCCKKEADISTNSDTTLTSLADKKAINKIEFLISVTIYKPDNRVYETTSADLQINYDTCTYSSILEAKINSIPLKETTSSYNIEVSKEGYNTYSVVMQLSEIKNWTDKPYVVNLYLK